MHEATTEVDSGRMYYRHNGLDAGRATVLFVHGLGESGLCFLEAFHQPLLKDFNIIVPDLLGFGKSSPATDNNYSFAQQIIRLRHMLDELGIAEVNLVGHSMGGLIGTLFCHQHGDRVLSFVNIEGDLTADNRFITDAAIKADAERRFEAWLRDDFTQQQVIGLCHQWPSTVRYLASLNMCRGPAFLASAYEIRDLIDPIPDSDTAFIGKTYLELHTQRVFCWGTESLTDITQAFLQGSTLRHEAFRGSFHWVMLDQTDRFYRFLSEFLTSQKDSR